jgi:hypothetical protein
LPKDRKGGSLTNRTLAAFFQKSQVTNFGGNIQFSPRCCYAPSTEAQVLELLDRHATGKVRVVGSLHSWSAVVVSEDVLVDLRRLDTVTIQQDPDGTVWATVGGGCRIKHLLRKLHTLAGVTMPSLGLVTEQTIAGAISTATHGSGKHSLSHYMTEVRVAAYDPDTGKARIFVWNEGSELRAARCSLGCMGIILSVRFRCIKQYDVAETNVPCDTLEQALRLQEQYPLQQFFLMPHSWAYYGQCRVAVDGPVSKRGWSASLYRAYWFFALDLGFHFIIKLLASVLDSPRLTRFFYRKLLASLIYSNRTVVDVSDRMLTMEHELFKHLEIEIFVSASQIRPALEFVRAVLVCCDDRDADVPDQLVQTLKGIDMDQSLQRLRGTFSHHYPICVRRVLADDTLISMTAGLSEDSYAISLITYVEPREPFLAVASFLAHSMTRLFQARLHWGKYFPLRHAEIEKSYPALAQFRGLCRKYDPRGVFHNEFAERVLGFARDSLDTPI